MSTAVMPSAEQTTGLKALTASAVATLDLLLDKASRNVRSRVSEGDRISSRSMEAEQRATHGLAWFATYVESLRQLDAYASRLSEQDRYGELEEIIVRLGFGEYLAQVFGGIPMNQGEFVRLSDLGLTATDIAAGRSEDIDEL
ncbi:MAG: acyl-CoA dehydrogenase, partial [Roseibium sp.]